MIHPAGITVRVREAAALSPTLKRFWLEPALPGVALPAVQPGAHVLLSLATPARVRKNSYSLVGATAAQYEIIVRRTADSRGGSAFLHDAVAPGHELAMALPQNLFPLSPRARRHLLLAGGIGVTPFLSYLPAAEAVELHHWCRTEDAAAFAGLHGGRLHTEAIPTGLDALLAAQGLGTHLYVCGPLPFMAMVGATARRLGWPAAKVHRESFGQGSHGGMPFVARLARSGLALAVDDHTTLLEAMEDAGVDAPYLCRGGACGECRVGVLDGVPEHHDLVLSAAERAAGDCMMACVSRARTPELVLDI